MEGNNVGFHGSGGCERQASSPSRLLRRAFSALRASSSASIDGRRLSSLLPSGRCNAKAYLTPKRQVETLL